MKSIEPIQHVSLWRKEHLYNIDFASYQLYNHSFSKHFHDHYVIELVTNGVDEFYCKGENFRATDNQFVFINPGEVHTGSTIRDTPLYYYSLYPDKAALEKIAVVLQKKIPHDFSFKKTLEEHPCLSNQLINLFKIFQHPNNDGKEEEVFLAFMYEILAFSNNEFKPEYFKEDTRINSLIDFIKGNFMKQLSLRDFSRFLNLDPFHLLRIFKKATGLSPYDYLIFIRIEFAKTLLKKGRPVQEAAQEAGFYDTSHFCRLFKRNTGMPPKDYRSYKSQYRTIFTA